MFGALYATNIGDLVILGIEGWRFSFMSIGVVSIFIGILTLLFGRDPKCRYTGGAWLLGSLPFHIS